MINVKIYTREKTILLDVAEDYGVELIWSGECVGVGYQIQSDRMSVFAVDSYVDVSDTFKDITSVYIPTKGAVS